MTSLLKENWEIKIFKFFKNKFSFQRPENQLRIINSSSVNIGVLDRGENQHKKEKKNIEYKKRTCNLRKAQGIELTFKKQHYCKILYQAQCYCLEYVLSYDLILS